MKKTPIRVYDLEGNFLEDFESLSDAEAGLNVSVQTIFSMGGMVSGVYQFRSIRPNTPFRIPPYVSTPRGAERIPVAKYYKGKLVTVYSSITQCEQKTGISKGSIQHAIENPNTLVYSLFSFKRIE